MNFYAGLKKTQATLYRRLCALWNHSNCSHRAFVPCHEHNFATRLQHSESNTDDRNPFGNLSDTLVARHHDCWPQLAVWSKSSLRKTDSEVFNAHFCGELCTQGVHDFLADGWGVYSSWPASVLVYPARATDLHHLRDPPTFVFHSTAHEEQQKSWWDKTYWIKSLCNSSLEWKKRIDRALTHLTFIGAWYGQPNEQRLFASLCESSRQS